METNSNQLKVSLLGGDEHLDNKDSSYIIKSKVIALISVVFLIMIYNNIGIGEEFTLTLAPSDCYKDYFFELTGHINVFLSENVYFKNILLIFSSFLVDLIVISTVTLWIFRWNDWIFPISVFFLYLVRAIFLSFYQQGYPDGYIFYDPGFPSVTVSYLKTNDFFYSGHVGFPVILYREYERRGFHKMKCFSLFVMIIQCLMMVFLRGHYSIDLIFGIIAGCYFHKITLDTIYPELNKVFIR